MPAYEYRCNNCQRVTPFFYKTVAAYETGQAAQRCPHCGGADLTRVIHKVNVAKPSKNYAGMSSNEMLSVFENGDPREVGRMIHEVGGDHALNDPAMADAAKRLMKGDDPAKIERDLTANTTTTTTVE